MDKIIPAHLPQKIGNFKKFQMLHPPGWQCRAKAPYCNTQPAATSSSQAKFCTTVAPTIMSGQLEDGPTIGSYKAISQKLRPVHAAHWT